MVSVTTCFLSGVARCFTAYLRMSKSNFLFRRFSCWSVLATCSYLIYFRLASQAAREVPLGRNDSRSRVPVLLSLFCFGAFPYGSISHGEKSITEEGFCLLRSAH